VNSPPREVSNVRHVLSVLDMGWEGLAEILDRSARWKGGTARRLARLGPMVALLLERPTLRTRLAYEGAVHRLGGRLTVFEGGVGTGDSLADTARVLSRMTNVTLVRTRTHAALETLAAHAEIPVVNALSDREHPVEVLADALTLREVFGSLERRKLAFVGCGGNVCHSVLLLAPMLGMDLAVATPVTHRPYEDVLETVHRLAEQHGTTFVATSDPEEAVAEADAVYTDAWPASDEDGNLERVFGSYRVDRRLMSTAQPEAIFLHCLPATRGREVTADVLDGPRSFAFRRLENLIPTSTALIEWVLEASKR
jgi:ornithine carbamoyltransferase